MHSTLCRDDQSFVSFNHPPLSLDTSQAISLPFTYYQSPPMEIERMKTKNFDKIASWLNHQQSPELKHIDEIQSGLSSRNVDHQGMKGT